MFEGVHVALVTPFREGRPDLEALTRIIEHVIAGGVAGLVPCGTTGESATMSHEEHREVIRHTVRQAAGRVKVMAGTGSNATAESIQLTRYAREVGADAALLITPYYNKPTQEGLYQHYRAVADAVDLPLFLYNVPGRTALDMSAETVIRLAQVPRIVGIKEATANMERASLVHQGTGGRMVLLSGDDATFLPFLAIGGHGVISVTANVVPAAVCAVYNAWRAGDTAAALVAHEALLELNGLMFCETNPIPVKAAMAMAGLCGPELRLPLTPLTSVNAQRLAAAMQRMGVALPGR
ncbi:MAG: 4-hydroxy-tetrahydrodipicolinate synthase [Magnetococcus sp. WYHC-3]